MNQALDIQMFHECSGEHFHDYPQIMVPLNDSMQIMIGGMQYDVTPQELCFVPTGMQHQCNFKGRLLVINLSDQMPESGEVVLISSPLIISMRGQIVQLIFPKTSRASPDPPQRHSRCRRGPFSLCPSGDTHRPRAEARRRASYRSGPRLYAGALSHAPVRKRP